MYGLDFYGNFLSGDMLEYMLNFFEDMPNAHLDLGEDVLGDYNCEIYFNCKRRF